jgi:transposase-like protein
MNWDKKKYKCEKCGKTFRLKTVFREHIRLCGRMKKYEGNRI